MLQQIPGSKAIFVNVGEGTEYVLCHSSAMGYFISVAVEAEHVVICKPHHAARIVSMLSQSMTILKITSSGSEEPCKIFGDLTIGDVKLTPADCATSLLQFRNPGESKYRFVNRDGNILRFSNTRGYYIDPTGPVHHIVNMYTEDSASQFLVEMRDRIERDGGLTDLRGRAVNRDLFIQEDPESF